MITKNSKSNVYHNSVDTKENLYWLSKNTEGIFTTLKVINWIIFAAVAVVCAAFGGVLLAVLCWPILVLYHILVNWLLNFGKAVCRMQINKAMDVNTIKMFSSISVSKSICNQQNFTPNN